MYKVKKRHTKKIKVYEAAKDERKPISSEFRDFLNNITKHERLEAEKCMKS